MLEDYELALRLYVYCTCFHQLIILYINSFNLIISELRPMNNLCSNYSYGAVTVMFLQVEINFNVYKIISI